MNITLNFEEKIDSTDEQQALIPQKGEEQIYADSSSALSDRMRMIQGVPLIHEHYRLVFSSF